MKISFFSTFAVKFVQDDLLIDTDKCESAHKEISIKTVQHCI